MSRQLRHSIRAVRRQLSTGTQVAHATAVARHLAIHPWFLYARHIGFYMALDGELNPKPLIDRARHLKKQCYLPRLSTGIHRHIGRAMEFLPDNASYRLNQYGIAEPSLLLHHRIDPQLLDLVIVPLVGFDRSGNRLGMGAGYYDRTFAFLRSQHSWHKPRLVGVAHALQETTALVPSLWDIPLDGIVTENELIIV